MGVDFGKLLGYNGPYGDDGFPVPGKLLKECRSRQGLSQDDVATILGMSRSMVAKMESKNEGLDSITTRRQIAGALGILPAALGLLTSDDVHTKVLYDTSLLKSMVGLHWEIYFAGGDFGGIQEIDQIILKIHNVSKSINHTDKGVLNVLAQYNQLGISVSNEDMDFNAVDRYAKNAFSLANVLQDTTLTASTILRYCGSLCERGDFEQAQKQALRGLKYVDIVAPYLAFGIYVAAVKAFASSDPTKAKVFAEKAYTIVRGPSGEDSGNIRPTLQYAQLYLARAYVGGGNYHEALDILDNVAGDDKSTRRMSGINVLRSRALIGMKEYNQATGYAQEALDIAKSIKSKPNIAQVGSVHQKLLQSPVSTSVGVKKLGVSLRKL